MRALQALFQFDLESSTRSDVVNVGGRVYVRFDHGWEPLAQRWYRQIRRLFLSKFHV
jgi:putative peptide zinc metalloprotease protein